MRHRYLGSTSYTLFVPEHGWNPVATTLSRITGWQVGAHDGNGWFHLQSDLPFKDLNDKIVAVALGRAITFGDEPLVIIRRADATVLVHRSRGGMTEVDRFVLPAKP